MAKRPKYESAYQGKHFVAKSALATFWQPTKKMRELGFQSVPCGPDGPKAWEIADTWERRWQLARRGDSPSPALVSAENLSPDQIESKTIYPPRSIGDGFKRFRRTPEWARKSPRTREDWWRGWKRIKPIFGDVDPRTVTLEDLSNWRLTIEETVSLREAHRAMKIWRAMWTILAALQYCDAGKDPSRGVVNAAPAGRNQKWREGEAVRLVKTAWRAGYHGLAVVMAVAWDTQLSPGDIRALRARQLVQAATGEAFFTERSKTGKPVGGILSPRSAALLVAYLERRGVELHADAFLFCNRSGSPYSKDTLGDDFRTVRAIAFGSDESRMLGHDFRRSGAVEAIAGHADVAEVAHAMGNTLSASNALFKTYVPVNLATLQSVWRARLLGRRGLREEQIGTKSLNRDGGKVGAEK